MIKLQTGDVLCFKGKGFFSWVIRLLTWLYTGDRRQFTHAAMAYSDSLIASAELRGFITITLEKAFKSLHRAVIFRYRAVTPKLKERVEDSIEKRLNANYDLSMYFLHRMRLNYSWIPLELLLSSLAGIKVFLISLAALIILYGPVKMYLKWRERKTFACSEVSTEILLENGMIRGIVDPTNISPQVVFYILVNGGFDIIYDGDGKEVI